MNDARFLLVLMGIILVLLVLPVVWKRRA